MNFFNHKYLCQFIETTQSTNLLLYELVEKKNSYPDFYCVVANYQTAAKAQGNKTWLSKKGENLLMSFYFQPQILPSQQIYFNYFFALTIRSVLSNFVDKVSIKKPNDIYVGEKKIAGILIEHHIQGEILKYTVAGVGININQTIFDSSLPNPTSLKLITGKTFDRAMILEEIIKTGNLYYQKLQTEAFGELEEEYERYLIRVKRDE